MKDPRPLAVESLLDHSTTDFDLYLEVGGVLTIYAKAPYKWERSELYRLLSDGQTTLYYSSSDQAKVEAYWDIHRITQVDLSAPPRIRVNQLTSAAAEVTRILYAHPLTASVMAKGEELARGLVDCIQEDRTCISALGKLASHDQYTYYHSARVAAYALAIALQLSETDAQRLNELALGCIFHDVGKSKVPLSILNKQGALRPEEWENMKLHPVFGDEIAAESLLSVVPRSIILHHHERLDGTGYPHNLSARELLEEVKIASFADVFDALTTNRPYQVSRTPYEALDFIRHKLLRNMHQDSFKAMVEILGLDDKMKHPEKDKEKG